MLLPDRRDTINNSHKTIFAALCITLFVVFCYKQSHRVRDSAATSAMSPTATATVTIEPEWQRRGGPQTIFRLIFSFALAGFGLFGLACQVRELLRARASIGWPAGEALITDARVRVARRGRRTNYNPEITYRYNHRGTEYTGRRLTFGYLTTERTEAESLVDRFAVGTRWEVRIYEARPQLSVLHPGVTSRLWYSLAFFVVFSIASVYILISVVATLR